MSATHECRTPISQRWFILYGPTVVNVRHDQFTLMMTMWATAVAEIAVARRANQCGWWSTSFMLSCEKNAGATSPRQRNGWCRPTAADHNGRCTSRGRRRGWRGLAQLHRSAVVLYTAMVWCAGYSGAAGRRRLGGAQYVGAMASTKSRRRERGTSNAKASPHSVGCDEAMLSATKIASSSPPGTRQRDAIHLVVPS